MHNIGLARECMSRGERTLIDCRYWHGCRRYHRSQVPKVPPTQTDLSRDPTEPNRWVLPVDLDMAAKESGRSAQIAEILLKRLTPLLFTGCSVRSLPAVTVIVASRQARAPERGHTWKIIASLGPTKFSCASGYKGLGLVGNRCSSQG